MGIAVGPSVATAGAVPAVEVGPAATLGPATRLFQDLAHAFALTGHHEVGFHFHPVQLGGYVPTGRANAPFNDVDAAMPLYKKPWVLITEEELLYTVRAGEFKLGKFATVSSAMGLPSW